MAVSPNAVNENRVVYFGAGLQPGNKPGREFVKAQMSRPQWKPLERQPVCVDGARRVRAGNGGAVSSFGGGSRQIANPGGESALVCVNAVNDVEKIHRGARPRAQSGALPEHSKEVRRNRNVCGCADQQPDNFLTIPVVDFPGTIGANTILPPADSTVRRSSCERVSSV